MVGLFLDGNGRSTHINDTVAQGEYECLQPGMHPQLGHDASHMVTLGRKAYVELVGDLLSIEAVG